MSEALDQVPELASAEVQQAATFRFTFAEERWEWSEEAARLHGYQPGEVVPTTELLVSHKHPEDRTRFQETVAEMLTHHSAFSSTHRIIDKQGRVHTVAVIAKTIVDEDGEVIGTDGFYLDLDEVVDDRLEEQVQKFRQNRAGIEQVKGMLMMTYGISDDRAFDLLRWRSQEDNVKVVELCERIAKRVLAEARPDIGMRRTLDHILLTAGQQPD